MPPHPDLSPPLTQTLIPTSHLPPPTSHLSSLTSSHPPPVLPPLTSHLSPTSHQLSSTTSHLPPLTTSHSSQASAMAGPTAAAATTDRAPAMTFTCTTPSWPSRPTRARAYAGLDPSPSLLALLPVALAHPEVSASTHCPSAACSSPVERTCTSSARSPEADITAEVIVIAPSCAFSRITLGMKRRGRTRGMTAARRRRRRAPRRGWCPRLGGVASREERGLPVLGSRSVRSAEWRVLCSLL